MKRFLMLITCVALVAAAGEARAQSASEDRIATVSGELVDDPRCRKVCVALLQAVGDDVKEQIYLTCDQISGACKGTGHLSLVNERVPVSVNSTLDGDELHLRIDGPKGSFGTEDGETLFMEIGPEMPWQVGQFVVHPISPDGRVSVGDQLVVTVLVEKLVDTQGDQGSDQRDDAQP